MPTLDLSSLSFLSQLERASYLTTPLLRLDSPAPPSALKMTPRVLNHSRKPLPRLPRALPDLPAQAAHASAFSPRPLYHLFKREEKVHLGKSLEQLHRARAQAAEWSSARRFVIEVDRVIDEGEAVAQRGGQDRGALSLELQRFFAEKAQVLADVYSNVPMNGLDAMVRKARSQVAQARAAGDRELARLQMEGFDLPQATHSSWATLKKEEMRIERSAPVGVHQRPSQEWVRDLIKLSYAIETAEALLPRKTKTLSGPTHKRHAQAIAQLNRAANQAKSCGDPELAGECADLIGAIEREGGGNAKWSELTEKKVNLLVEVWSTFPELNSHEKSIHNTLHRTRTDLVAVKKFVTRKQTDFVARFHNLQENFNVLVDPAHVHTGDLLEDALKLRYAAQQLLENVQDARPRIAAHELAHEREVDQEFAPMSQRTAERYQL